MFSLPFSTSQRFQFCANLLQNNTCPTSPNPSSSSAVAQLQQPHSPPLPQQQQLDVCSLSAEQLECLCHVLENCANFGGLSHLLTHIESSQCGAHLDNHSVRNIILRARALCLFHERRFTEFRAHICSNEFAHADHAVLQRMWNELHYAEAEEQRGKKLDPVSRYRVRKKNLFPRSIWDGEGTSYCFKKSARQILRDAYRQQTMPSQTEKVRLARLTQLSVLQVSNWFKNQRQRARQQRGGGRDGCISSKCAYSDSDDGAESEGRENGAGESLATTNGEVGDHPPPAAEELFARGPFLRPPPNGHLAVNWPKGEEVAN